MAKKRQTKAKKEKSTASNDEEYITIDLTKLVIPGAIIIGSIIIALGLFLGLKAQGGRTSDVAGTDTTETPTEVEVSIGEAAFKGSEDAPVTIIEFSDFECPYCQKHFNETLPQIQKEYIDQGKVKYVFRHYPLSFHDPEATNEALAAECAREQGKFWEYHDILYKRTETNKAGIDGKGAGKKQLVGLAQDVGLDIDGFTACFDEKRYQARIDNDKSDGNSYGSQLPDGAMGTPSFFICGSTAESSTCKATSLAGAYPYESFKEVIESYLTK